MSQSQTVVLGVNKQLIGKPDYLNPDVVNQKEQFEKWLFEYYGKASNTSYVLSRSELDFIKEVLLGKKQYSTATERFNFRKKKYTLMSNNQVGQSVKDVIKQVISIEEMFEVIYKVHAVDRGLQGINKTRSVLEGVSESNTGV